MRLRWHPARQGAHRLRRGPRARWDRLVGWCQDHARQLTAVVFVLLAFGLLLAVSWPTR